jgi:hypothetical protein
MPSQKLDPVIRMLHGQTMFDVVLANMGVSFD